MSRQILELEGFSGLPKGKNKGAVLLQQRCNYYAARGVNTG